MPLNTSIPAVQPALPRDFVPPCLLLLLREQAAHGYDLIERLGTLGIDGADPGRIYRSLRKLEERGFVHSAWAASNSGPQRRIYEITRAGREELHRRGRAFAAGRRYLDGFLSRYQEFVSLEASGEHDRPRREEPAVRR